MSISKIQEKFLSQKGCATAIAVGTSFIMSFFLFQSCGRFNGQGNQDESGAKNAVATVGDVPITSDQVAAALNEMESQQQSMMGATAPPPTFESTARIAPFAIDRLLNAAALQTVAEQDHISLSDDSILAAAKSMLDQEQPPSKKLDPKRDEQTKQVMSNLKTALSDPQRKAALLDRLMPQIVQNGLLSTVSATPAQVKQSYDDYEIKRIFIANRPGVDAKAKAQEALKAIKGGMSFESAMDKYSNDVPQGKGKKVSDSKMDMPESQISTLPNFKAIDGKPAGFVSDPIDDTGGLVIYKVVSIHNNAPKDFAANPEKYRKQFAESLVQMKIQAQVKAVTESNAVKWNSNGYKALFDLGKAMQGMGLGPDAAMQKIIDEAKASMQSPGDRLPALYAWFSAESSLYEKPGANKAKMRADRIELLKAVLQSSEDYALRMELVDLYVQQKDGTDALQNLVQASQANSTYDVTGQEHFRDIAAKGALLVSQKLVTSDELQALNGAQASWRKSKADSDKMEAQTKAEEAQQKLQDAANEKANEELIKKQKAEAAKNPATGAGKPATTAGPFGSGKINASPPPGAGTAGR